MPINTDPHIHNLVLCANIFVRKDGKYLVMKRSPSKKYLPNAVHPIGGKLDPHEDPYIGAQRELLEEAGIIVKNMRLEAVILEIKPDKNRDENWLIFHFSGDYESGEIKETEEGELILLTPEEIQQQELFPSVKASIKHILNPEAGTVFLTVMYDGNEQMIEQSNTINFCAK